jgi:hypothetical protein
MQMQVLKKLVLLAGMGHPQDSLGHLAMVHVSADTIVKQEAPPDFKTTAPRV